MHNVLPPGIKLIKAENFDIWLMDIQVIDANPLYQGETYRLKFTFSQNYPIEVSLALSAIPFAIFLCCIISLPTSHNLLTRFPRPGTRGGFREGRRAHNTMAPAHLLERHHLP